MGVKTTGNASPKKRSQRARFSSQESYDEGTTGAATPNRRRNSTMVLTGYDDGRTDSEDLVMSEDEEIDLLAVGKNKSFSGSMSNSDDENDEVDGSTFDNESSPLSETLIRRSNFSDEEDEGGSTDPLASSPAARFQFIEVSSPGFKRPSSVPSPLSSSIVRPTPVAASHHVLVPKPVPILSSLIESNSRILASRFNAADDIMRSAWGGGGGCKTPPPSESSKYSLMTGKRTNRFDGRRSQSLHFANTPPSIKRGDTKKNSSSDDFGNLKSSSDLDVSSQPCPQYAIGECDKDRSECEYDHGEVDPPYPDLVELEETVGSRKVRYIECASVDRLIEELIDSENKIYDFRSEFLLVFPQFCTVEYFSSKLVQLLTSVASIRDRVLTIKSDDLLSSTVTRTSYSEPTSPLVSGGRKSLSDLSISGAKIDVSNEGESVYRLITKFGRSSNSSLTSGLRSSGSFSSVASVGGRCKSDDEVDVDRVNSNCTQILSKGLGLIRYWSRQEFVVEDFSNDTVLDTLLTFLGGTIFRENTVKKIAKDLYDMIIDFRNKKDAIGLYSNGEDTTPRGQLLFFILSVEYFVSGKRGVSKLIVITVLYL